MKRRERMSLWIVNIYLKNGLIDMHEIIIAILYYIINLRRTSYIFYKNFFLIVN